MPLGNETEAEVRLIERIIRRGVMIKEICELHTRTLGKREKTELFSILSYFQEESRAAAPPAAAASGQAVGNSFLFAQAFTLFRLPI